MDAIVTAIAVNVAGLVLAAIAMRKRAGMDPGPRLLLDFSLFLLGIALLCVAAALMLDFPESRGVFAVVALAVLTALIVRRVRRRGAWTVRTAAAEPEPDQLRRVPLSALGTFIPAGDAANRSARAQAAMRKAVTQ